MVKRKLFIPKGELARLYLKEGRSTHEMGNLLRVDSKTVWYWLKKYGVPVRSRSESLKGERNYMYGTHHSEEHKKKVSKKLRGRKLSKDTCKKISDRAREQWRNPTTRRRILESLRNDEYRKKMSESLEGLWEDPKYISKVTKARNKSLMEKPTLPEQKLIEVIEKYDLPLKYVGDGEVVIGRLNPDFIHTNGEKKVIEVFGRTFHDPEESFRKDIPWHQQYWGRMAYFAQHGYDCLIIWDDELDNEQEVIEKMRRFVDG